MNNNPDMTTTPPIPLSPRARHPHSPFDDIPLSSSSSSNDAIRIAFILPNSDVRPQFHLPSESSIEDVKRKLEMHIGWDSSASMQNSVTKGSTVTLISHGRMLGDKEQLKDIFVDRINSTEIHYIHVVQRRPQSYKSTSTSNRIPATSPIPAASPSTTLPSTNQTSTLMLNPAYLAVSDSISLCQYLSRNAICEVVSMPTMAWDEMQPKPRVGLEAAMNAVGEFLQVNSLERTPKDHGRLEVLAKPLIDELLVKQSRGEETALELDLDGSSYKLVIPEPQNLTAEQRHALARFQFQAELIKSLHYLQRSAQMYIPMPTFSPTPAPTPTPTPTTRPDVVPPQPGQVFAHTIILNLLSLSVIRLFPAFFMSGIKVSIVLWMLTRDMKWTDRTFMAMAVVAMAWWLWECVSTIKRNRERERVERVQEDALRRVRAEREAREPFQQQQQQLAANEAAQAPPAQQPVARAAAGGGIDNLGLPRRRSAGRRREPIGATFALFCMDQERRSLRLFYVDSRTASTIQSPTDHRIPSSDVNLPLPPRDPNFLRRWIIMPIYLFVISATPAADAARKMAIRQREIHMRLLVQKLTKVAEDADKEERDRLNSQQDAVEGAQLEVAVEVSQEDAPHPSVLPRGLSKSAERYYRRVLQNSEMVDWEEEREAQAALLREAGGDGREPGEDIAFF